MSAGRPGQFTICNPSKAMATGHISQILTNLSPVLSCIRQILVGFDHIQPARYEGESELRATGAGTGSRTQTYRTIAKTRQGSGTFHDERWSPFNTMKRTRKGRKHR